MLCAQVLPEVRRTKRSAEEVPDRVEREEWRKRARDFLYDRADGDQSQPAHKKPRMTRIANYQWLCALDAGLQASCGFGLARFRLPSETQLGGASSASEGGGAAPPPAPAAGSASGIARLAGASRGRGMGKRKRGLEQPAPAAGSRAAPTGPSEAQLAVARQKAESGELPVLSLCIDQGAVGWPSIHFLLGGGCT